MQAFMYERFPGVAERRLTMISCRPFEAPARCEGPYVPVRARKAHHVSIGRRLPTDAQRWGVATSGEPALELAVKRGTEIVRPRHESRAST